MTRKRRKPLPTDIFTGTVEALSDEGRGIIHQEGKTYFINGVLPDETVEFQITKMRRRVIDAKVVSIKTASNKRIAPKCQHAEICGGCSLQHISEEAQIAMKQDTLLKQLKHFGQVEPDEVLAPVTAHPYGYRRKARLGVRFVDKKDKLLIGFREKNTRYLADIESCEVLDTQVNRLLTPLKEMISQLSIMREIPQIEVAVGDDQVALVFRHLEPLTEKDLEQLINFAKVQQVHVYGQSGNEETIKRLYPPAPLEESYLSYRLEKHQIDFAFRPTDFVQVNASINQQLIDRVLEYLQLDKTDRVLDLFCGLGNVTLPIARYAGKVVGVEWSDALTTRAKANALANNLLNVEFFAADLTKKQTDAAWLKLEYDKCVLDPPRSGAAEIIEQLAGHRFKKIVYVSCKPATLARDAGLLREQGYRLVKAGVLDMFPHTAHVESIAVFEPT